MFHQIPLKNSKLSKLTQRIINLTQDFEKVYFFHVLQKKNGEVDALTNLGARTNEGLHKENGGYILLIPLRN